MNKERGFASSLNTIPDDKVPQICSNKDEASSGSSDDHNVNVNRQCTSSFASSLISRLSGFSNGNIKITIIYNKGLH